MRKYIFENFIIQKDFILKFYIFGLIQYIQSLRLILFSLFIKDLEQRSDIIYDDNFLNTLYLKK
jgi:hypothetical protein